MVQIVPPRRNLCVVPHAVNDAGQVVGETQGPLGASHAVRWSTWTGLRDLGSAHDISVAYGINSRGDVVGQTGGHAFLWTASGRKLDLGTLGGDESEAHAT